MPISLRQRGWNIFDHLQLEVNYHLWQVVQVEWVHEIVTLTTSASHTLGPDHQGRDQRLSLLDRGLVPHHGGIRLIPTVCHSR